MNKPRLTATLVAAALAVTLSMPSVASATRRPHSAPLPPHVDPATFGTVASSGDAVTDCGEWVLHTDRLPDAAVEAVSVCLDFHGWTYSTTDPR